MRCDAGVMISASHNAYQDNGIKFFSHDGFKLPDEVERRIEELIASGVLESHRVGPAELGRARRIDDAAGRYVVFLKKTFPMNMDLTGLRVVLDCANGAAYKVGPTVFEELGADVTAIMGGCTIDLRGADIGTEPAVIDAFAFWGGIEILVPEGWAVTNKVLPLLGSAADKTRPMPGASRQLLVRGTSMMAGVEISHENSED